jgi:hypothetical protein
MVAAVGLAESSKSFSMRSVHGFVARRIPGSRRYTRRRQAANAILEGSAVKWALHVKNILGFQVGRARKSAQRILIR